MSKVITFVIDNGQVEIKATGFKGSSCEAATKAYEEALGGKILHREKTPEFFQHEVRTQKLGSN